MKNFIVLTISLILIITGGIYEIKYFKDSSQYAIVDVEYSKNLVDNNKFSEASAHIEELEKTWNNMKDIWNIFINHDEIDDIQEAMINYKMYTRLQNREEALVYAEILSNNFTHIAKKEYIKLDNVF
ncbi:MAG: DUF4363 family protein [Clostridia bacterium]